MWVGLTTTRVTLFRIPPRLPVVFEPGTFTIFSWAWYIIAMPSGMRWLTTTRATVAPLLFRASTQSLSLRPMDFASRSETHTTGPPRNKVSMVRLSL